MDLWHTLLEENVLLSCFAAATLVFTVPLRLLLIVLNRTVCHQVQKRGAREDWTSMGSWVRRLERLAKQFSLGHIWAESIFLVWLYIFTRNKDEFQFCARMPIPPLGLIAIAVLGVGVPSASHILDMMGMIGLTPFSPGRRFSHLPGGGLLWGGGPLVSVLVCIYLLSLHGPPPSPDIVDLSDLNGILRDRILPKVNEHIHRHMPVSKGLCQELESMYGKATVDGMTTYNSTREHSHCMGHAPLSKITTDSGMDITVKWATGLNELEITNMSVHAPQRVAPDSHLWNLTLSGVFTNLHVWVQAISGDRQWLDDNVCCDKDFKFTIQASAFCNDTVGFGNIDLGVVYVDRPEIGHTIDSWKGSDGEGFIKIDFGDIGDVSHTDIRQKIQDYMRGGKGQLMMKFQEGGPKDVMEYVRKRLNRIIELNRDGEKCPPALNDPTTVTTTTSTAVRIIDEVIEAN